MSDFVLDKKQITHKILSILSPNYDQKKFLHVSKSWWTNKREQGGLGLSYLGMQAFQDADIEGYEVKTSSSYTSAFVLLLDRRMQCPYYVYPYHKKSLIVYDGRIAGLVQLYDTIESYLAVVTDREPLTNKR